MRRVTVLMLFWSNFALTVSANAQQHLTLQWSGDATPDARARQLLAAMTIDEKILLLAGHHSEDKDCGNYIGRVGSEDCVSPMNHSIPELHLNDAGQGFRDENNSKPGSSTQWPSALAMAATWDTSLAQQWGKAMGEEFKGKGANVQLGPGMCIARVPRNGRNFEYLSGEDPVLGASIVAPVVRGIQSAGVIAVGKHFALNNQESNRTRSDSIVDERTRFELYYGPFQGAIDAGIGSLMCSYNLINGEWSCQNNATLNTDLKDRMGFDGWVMSDWGACHNSSINEGLDQEMPAARFYNPTGASDSLGTRISDGDVSIARLDDAVLRVLRPMFAVGLFDAPPGSTVPTTAANVTSAAHTKLAQELASAGMVLLKNNRTAGGAPPLPLDATSKGLRGKRIAIIGAQAWGRDAANGHPIVGGEGSGAVKAAHVVAPLDSILARLGMRAADNHSCDASVAEPRSACTWTTQQSASATPSSSGPSPLPVSCSAKPTLPGYDLMGFDLLEPPVHVNGTSACCALCVGFRPKTPSDPPCIAWTLANDGSCYLKWSLKGKQVNPGRTSSSITQAPTPVPPGPAPSPLPSPAPTPSPVPVDATTVLYDSGTDPARAGAVAASADVTILFGATVSGEGHDREHLRLDDIPYSSYPRFSANASFDFLAAQVTRAVRDSARGGVVVVSMVAPGAVTTPWRDDVDAIVLSLLPGQEYGAALADVLFGDVEPSGRLPITLPLGENDLEMSASQWPGVRTKRQPTLLSPATDDDYVMRVEYSEKLLVGYRGYDAKAIAPAFPFGHGLGYTTFEYSGLKCNRDAVSFTLTNSGRRDGSTVAQLYLEFPSGAGEPARQLKGFQKLFLHAGASQRVTLVLNDRALSIWDVDSHQWAVQAGAFGCFVGESSRDVRLSGSFTVTL